MSKKEIAQMVEDSLSGCRIENVIVIETTLVPEEKKAIVQVLLTPNGSYSVLGKVEVPYTPTPKDIRVRDEILFGCKINYSTNEGVEYFSRVRWEELWQLAIIEGYAVSTSLEFSFKELIEHMKETGARAEGYATQTMVLVAKVTVEQHKRTAP